MSIYIIGQALTLISYIVFWVSRYMESKKNILLYDNISRCFAILAFICLKTFDGIKNTLFVIVRNVVGNKISKQPRKTKLSVFIVMIICLCLLYITSFNNVATICVFICGILNLYGVIMCDEQGIRLYGLIGSGFYAMFLLFTGNYTGFVCELICAVIMYTSYRKYNKINNNEINQQTA